MAKCALCLSFAFFPRVQEYFSLPLMSLSPVLRAADNHTVRLILQYYSRVKDTLQVSTVSRHHYTSKWKLCTDLLGSLSQVFLLTLFASVYQLPDRYLSTMVSVLLQTHLVKDATLFPDLVPMLTAASPADILALPSLQNNINVWVMVSRYSNEPLTHTMHIWLFGQQCIISLVWGIETLPFVPSKLTFPVCTWDNFRK